MHCLSIFLFSDIQEPYVLILRKYPYWDSNIAINGHFMTFYALFHIQGNNIPQLHFLELQFIFKPTCNKSKLVKTLFSNLSMVGLFIENSSVLIMWNHLLVNSSQLPSTFVFLKRALIENILSIVGKSFVRTLFEKYLFRKSFL